MENHYQFLLNPCNNESLVEKIFNNSVIVENILENSSENLMYNLSLRQVNQQFNSTCLKIIRGSHRTVKIKFMDGALGNEASTVYINHREVYRKNIGKFLNFLMNYAKAKIEHIITKRLWRLEESFKVVLHDIIHETIGNGNHNLKTFIGMEDICITGCSKCLRVLNRLRRYGPTQIQFFDKKLESHHNFEELIVTDYILDDLANKCVETTNSKEECYENLKQLIDSNISCDNLTVHLSELRKYPAEIEENEDEDEENEENDDLGPRSGHLHFPREVLEMMMRIWEVRSIKIVFFGRVRTDIYLNRWLHTGWFTKFRFNDHFQYNKQSCLNMNFSRVTTISRLVYTKLIVF